MQITPETNHNEAKEKCKLEEIVQENQTNKIFFDDLRKTEQFTTPFQRLVRTKVYAGICEGHWRI